MVEKLEGAGNKNLIIDVTGGSIKEAFANAMLLRRAALKGGEPYDFVFSDFWMPIMNGLEFVEKLRADERFQQLPVYAVTADTEFQSDARHDLFNGILLKPITFGQPRRVKMAAMTPAATISTAKS